MTDWEELAGAALLGTARRSVDPATLPGTLGATAARASAADPAQALLQAAALAVPYLRAGSLPQADAGEPPAPAPPETLRSPSPMAAARLKHLLATRQASAKDLLLEWLATAAEAGTLAPPETVPQLLDASLRDRVFGAAAVRVIGERGRWLAQFRPDWQRVLATHAAAAAPASVEVSAWEIGDEATRRSLFAELRRTAPAVALDLLKGSWDQEKGEDREAFLDSMGIGLSAADETLLEPALDDRRRGVRERAAVLLQRLPSSAYGARMTQRAAAMVSVEHRMLRSRLSVKPPGELDEAMRRDGLGGKAPQGIGAQAWIAYQIVAATPLAAWAAITDAQPQQLLKLSAESDWNDALSGGWLLAVRRQRDPVWADAVLNAAVTHTPVAELVALIEPQRQAELVAAAVKAAAGGPVADLPALLDACPVPWPGALSDQVLATIAKRVSQPVDPTIRELLRKAAHGLPPGRADEVMALAIRVSGDAPIQPLIAACASTLTFRREMIEELR